MNSQPIHRAMLVLLAVIAFAVWLRSDVQAVQRQFSEGESSYTPSKLEWLAMELNVKYSVSYNAYELSYDAVPRDNSIVIIVRYYDDLDRRELDQAIQDSRRIVQDLSRSYGWDSWVRVVEDVKPYESWDEVTRTPIDRNRLLGGRFRVGVPTKKHRTLRKPGFRSH